jgi:hypothetical protein
MKINREVFDCYSLSLLPIIIVIGDNFKIIIGYSDKTYLTDNANPDINFSGYFIHIFALFWHWFL